MSTSVYVCKFSSRPSAVLEVEESVAFTWLFNIIHVSVEQLPGFLLQINCTYIILYLLTHIQYIHMWSRKIDTRHISCRGRKRKGEHERGKEMPVEENAFRATWTNIPLKNMSAHKGNGPYRHNWMQSHGSVTQIKLQRSTIIHSYTNTPAYSVYRSPLNLKVFPQEHQYILRAN